MAYVTATRLPAKSLADHVFSLIAALKEARERRAHYRQAYGELNKLNRRELAEFGMHHGDLEEIARREAYGE
jgi:uncharacterized protein YjiS (DUF1127 family)